MSLAGAASAGVEVFTIAGLPVTNAPENTPIVELDAPARLDAQISQGLPGDPDQARQAMRERVSRPDWPEMKARYQSAYTGLTRAWMLGIEKVPAVVVDGQYVVYGEPNVARALSTIDQAKRQEAGQ
tara:strand:- start:519 stop:899 length:381 start_codon:yes stop_codon:yes gene_type:complete